MSDNMLGDPNQTRKIRGLPVKTEEQTAQEQYNTAFDRLLKEPTQENITAFNKANKNLFEVKDAYRLGWILLQERAKRLGRAIYEVTFK